MFFDTRMTKQIVSNTFVNTTCIKVDKIILLYMNICKNMLSCILSLAQAKTHSRGGGLPSKKPMELCR